MIDLVVRAAGIAVSPEPPEWETHPAFRRATRNMKLAVRAAEPVLKEYAGSRERLGLVIATSHGELETTCQFLRELGESGTARPLLFQNSLHNATSGFLSTYFSITGPTFTVSNRYFSGENALELASLLIGQGSADACLVIGVDSAPGTLEKMLHKMYPEGTTLVGGAAALLVDGKEGSVHLQRIEYQAVGTHASLDPSPFYDANAIEQVVRWFEEGCNFGAWTLIKPDGSGTRLVFGAAP